MVYFFPVIPAVEPGPTGLLVLLLTVNLVFNGLPCVLTALALWQTARWRGIPRPWRALIPVMDLWVLGTLRDKYHSRGRRMARALPALGTGALGSIAVVALAACLMRILGADPGVEVAVTMLCAAAAIVLWVIFLVMRLVTLCEMYQSMEPSRAGWYIVFSILFPPLMALFIFKCRW